MNRREFFAGVSAVAVAPFVPAAPPPPIPHSFDFDFLYTTPIWRPEGSRTFEITPELLGMPEAEAKVWQAVKDPMPRLLGIWEGEAKAWNEVWGDRAGEK